MFSEFFRRIHRMRHTHDTRVSFLIYHWINFLVWSIVRYDRYVYTFVHSVVYYRDIIARALVILLVVKAKKNCLIVVM